MQFCHSDISFRDAFLDLTPKQGGKSKYKQVGLHQSKKLLHSKANTIKTQKQYTEWEKIAGNCISCESESCSVVSDSLRPHGLYSLWNYPGQNTGVPFPSPEDLPNPGI